MKIVPVKDQQIFETYTKKLGGEPTNLDLIAESLRSELAARQTSSKRGLLRAVFSLLANVQAIDEQEIKNTFDTLELAGDVVAGPGGQVAAAPIRAVPIAEGVYQLFGCIDYTHLCSVLSGCEVTPGAQRLLTFGEQPNIAIDEVVAQLGGIVLSPDRWAGLDKVKGANQQWLEELDIKLKKGAQPAGIIDDQLQNDWQVYISDGSIGLQKKRWRKSTEKEDGRLWRAWHVRGWPVFAWTSGGSPKVSAFMRVNSDEACRTMYSLDRLAGTVISCHMYKEGKDSTSSVIKIGGYLPKAEYRFLTTLGMLVGIENDYLCFQLPGSSWQEAILTLKERLGIPE